MEKDAEIPYPLPNCMQIDFCEIVNNSELEKRATEIQINEFNKNVLVLNKGVLVKELFVFVLEHHISKQYKTKNITSY